MKKVLGVILVVVMLFSMCACSTNTAENESMKLRYIGLKVYDPVYIALEKGFFDKYNIDVELLETVAGGATAIQMVSGGNAEACLNSYMALSNAVNNGLPVKAVADIQSSFEEAPLEEFFVRKDSDIKSVADLKGKKIAINLVKSSFHYTWLMELEKAGIAENEVEFVILPFDQQELALEQGQVDAIGLMSPYIKHAKENENFRVLYDACDTFGEKQFCGIVINSVWAENNKDAATAFVSGISDASAWAMENQEEAKHIISKYTGVDAKYIDDYKFQEYGKVVMEDAQYWLDYMKGRGDVKDWVTVDDIATNEYNERVR